MKMITFETAETTVVMYKLCVMVGSMYFALNYKLWSFLLTVAVFFLITTTELSLAHTVVFL